MSLNEADNPRFRLSLLFIALANTKLSCCYQSIYLSIYLSMYEY